MRSYKIYIITLIILFNQSELFSQNGKSNFYSLTQISQLGDTIEIDVFKADIVLYWLNDTLKITRCLKPYEEILEYHLDYKRKLKKDSNYEFSEDERERLLDLIIYGEQNCHSYSTEKIFEFSHVATEGIIDHRAFLTGKPFEQILKTTFIKFKEFPINKRKYLKEPIPDGTVIVFFNNRNESSHSVFYNNGVFYSKNGKWKEEEYNKLEEIIKLYVYTKSVEYYRLDINKLEEYIKQGQTQK